MGNPARGRPRPRRERRPRARLCRALHASTRPTPEDSPAPADVHRSTSGGRVQPLCQAGVHDMTTTKHYAAGPDRNGDTHTRSSVSTGKTFLFCVVTHAKTWSSASWSSRRDLAEGVA